MSFDASLLARIDRHFQRYVDDGRLVGWQLQVGQHGQVAHSATYGLADREAERPVAEDTLWRIYSMTKPIVSVAFMSLWEEGLVELTDEVARYVPSFADVKVFRDGSATKAFLEPALEPIRLWHLLTHTSGLTYGFLQVHPVDAMYRAAGSDIGNPAGNDLAANCDLWASLPLRFQPGTAWGYGVSTDVLGRVCEVVAGKPLDEVVRERVLAPLGMSDTRWWADGDQDRLAALYAAYEGKAVRYDVLGDGALKPPVMLSGGGGLLSTAADYWRFSSMLLGRGSLDGVRVLAPRTVDLMARNHLPGGQDLGRLNSGGFAETVMDGVGFGLGFATVLDHIPARGASSVGEFYWGGLASTAFWVDPSTGVTATFFTQLVPSSTYPVRAQLRQLVYSALID
ncbi:MAG: serine hydrolase domain-containing protein [Mycobacteriales bacterium]